MIEIEKPLLGNLNAFVGFARKRLNDAELAADVVQESLLKALRATNSPAEEEKVTAWFYQILRRTMIDLFRREAVRKQTLDAFEQELDREQSEDERVICHCFRELIPTLPAQYGNLLEAVDLGGASPKEMAGRMNMSLNNLNVRLHRARVALRERLEDVCRACSVHGCLDCTCEDRGSS